MKGVISKARVNAAVAGGYVALVVLTGSAFGLPVNAADVPSELVSLQGDFERNFVRGVEPMQRKYKEALGKY